MRKYKIRISLICVLFMLTQSFVSVAQTETPLPTLTQIIPRSLNRGDVLVYTSLDNVWKVNLDTGERTLFYQNPPETTLRGWSIDRNREVIYTVEVPQSKKPEDYIGIFDLVQIDLLTGNQTIIWQKENLIAAELYQPNPDYLLITYFPHVEKYFWGLRPNVCLFSLKDHTCVDLEKEAASTLASYNHKYWLTDETFLTFHEVEPFLVTKVNLYNNDTEILLENWIIYSFTHVPNTRDLLVVAKLKQTISSEDDIGFYLLNLDTFNLSEKIHPAPKFDGAQIQFSTDGKYLLFNWQYSNHPKLQIIDYEKWNTIFDMQEPVTLRGLPTTLEWLPDENILVGQVFYTENHKSSFVRINPVTGDIKLLFTTDERLYFTVIQ